MQCPRHSKKMIETLINEVYDIQFMKGKIQMISKCVILKIFEYRDELIWQVLNN